VSVRAKFSTSVEESTTSQCSFDLQTTGAPFSIMRDPAVDLDVDGLPAKSASEYATTFVPSCCFRQNMPLIRRAATTWSENGLAKNRAK
ncbi:hypothetical protein K470DRAFT_259202, partial [Piedraia hortae CBS 480.64]